MAYQFLCIGVLEIDEGYRYLVDHRPEDVGVRPFVGFGHGVHGVEVEGNNVVKVHGSVSVGLGEITHSSVAITDQIDNRRVQVDCS